jgi:TPR repeat protein
LQHNLRNQRSKFSSLSTASCSVDKFLIIKCSPTRGDYVEAARLYRLAADQRDATGQAYLGDFYEQGKGGLPKNVGEAVRLYRLAAQAGNTYAQQHLKVLGQTW